MLGYGQWYQVDLQLLINQVQGLSVVGQVGVHVQWYEVEYWTELEGWFSHDQCSLECQFVLW